MIFRKIRNKLLTTIQRCQQRLVYKQDEHEQDPFSCLTQLETLLFYVADEVETCVQSSIPVLYQDKFYICIHRQEYKILSSLQQVSV